MNPEQINLNDEQELWSECQKSHEPHSAKALAELMSDISEQCMCARWCIGTVIILWDIMHSLKTPEDRFWGIDEVSFQDINQLQKLSEKCGGWWIWREEKEQKESLSLDEAEDCFKIWNSWGTLID